jgi:hypothetical protein
LSIVVLVRNGATNVVDAGPDTATMASAVPTASLYPGRGGTSTPPAADSWQIYASESDSRQDYASSNYFPGTFRFWKQTTSEGRRGNDMPHFGKVILKVTMMMMVIVT